MDKVDSSIEMEKVVNSLFHLGGLMKGFPPIMSPSLEDFGFMQYAQEPLRPAADDFRIMMNVRMFQPHEVEIHVLGKKVLEIRTRHDKRQDDDGLWFSRNCVYTYDLPQEVIDKELHAEWSDDNVLCIQATRAARVEDCEKVRLVPQHVQTTLRPVMDPGIVKDLFEDIRDRALLALRYIRFHNLVVPSLVLKQQPGNCHLTPSSDSQHTPSDGTEPNSVEPLSKDGTESSSKEEQQMKSSSLSGTESSSSPEAMQTTSIPSDPSV